jgi:Icc-related predicted phosphoesterase
MENNKKVFKLAKTPKNINQFNGWNYFNEKLWNSLTHIEKKLVNNIMENQIEHFLPHERTSFKNIVNFVKPPMGENPIILQNAQIQKILSEINGY